MVDEHDQDHSHILVVDDNKLMRMKLARGLEQLGHTVSMAENGFEALAVAREEDFDLVLLDILMPEMDGYEALERLKADELLRHIPVVVVSALDEMDSVVRCIEMGAEDYLPKPFDPVLLRARIGACLEKKRLHDQEEEYRQKLQGFNARLRIGIEEATAEIRKQSELIERRLRETRAMTEVSVAISSLMPVDDVLGMIMDTSKEVMHAEASSLLMLNKETGKLRFHVARGEAGSALESVEIEPGKGISGWVAQRGKPLLIPDAYKDSRFDSSHDKKTGFRTRSILTVPLKMKDEVIGVVQVVNKTDRRSFDEDDLTLFNLFAGMASVAIENARLYEETRRMAEELRVSLERERWLRIERDKVDAYIPEGLKDEIARKSEESLALGGKSAEAAILFSDIKGFTKLSEHMDPSRIVKFLNAYMSAMAHLIQEEGGSIDKFIGDGIMATFAGETEGGNHALRAVRAGVAMQQRMGTLREELMAIVPELDDVQIRIGINAGEVVAGSIGSETRRDYTVIGDNVNVASRLESVGMPGGVYISEAVYEQVAEVIEAEKLEPISVKNRTQPVQAYSVKIPLEQTD